MKVKIYFLPFILLVSLGSCSTNSEITIENINGYWEIMSVEKNNTLIKKYSINSTVDYFKLKNDLTGFRKKVIPTLEGKYIITKHNTFFIIKFENDSLNIYYQNNESIIKETIIKLSKTELIIVNSEGFKYIYKPFKKTELLP